VLRPDVNESMAEFTVVPAGIRWGMAAVRNVGRGAVDQLVAAREKDGKFQDLADLCARVDLRQVNKKVLEGLIKAGAMDDFRQTRATLLANLDCCLEHGQRVQKEAQSGQFGLFDEGDMGQTTFAEVCKVRESEFDKRVLLDMEKEMLGIYLSDSPLSEYREVLQRYSTHRIADLGSLPVGSSVAIAGLVTSVRKIMPRFKTQMAFLQVEDFSGSTEVTLRPQAYEKYSSLCVDGAIVVAKGATEVRQARQAREDEEEDEEAPAEEFKLTAEELLSVEKLAANYSGNKSSSKTEGRYRGLNIRVQLFQGDSLSRLRDILLRHRGAREVYLHLESPQGTTIMHLPEAFGVDDGPRLVTEVEALLGRETVWVN
jgi:DNA polymerase-3 subunit alpha